MQATLDWVHHQEPAIGMFGGQKVFTATLDSGRYEVWRHCELFYAWFTRADGVLIHIGQSERCNTARRLCEDDLGRGISLFRRTHPGT